MKEHARCAGTYGNFVLSLMLCLLFFSFPREAVSQDTVEYAFSLINKTDSTVKKIVLIPYGLIQIHTETSLKPGEKITIARPKCGKMKIEISLDKQQFSFPATDFSNEKNTTLSLMERKDTVPLLRFEERKRGNITGDNSSWGFNQILGSIPFGVGITTLEDATKKGARAEKERHILQTSLSWNNRNWDLSLNFAGDQPESRLRQLVMIAKGAHGKTPAAIHEELMAHGYVYYSVTLGKTPRELYVTVPLARALERANLSGRNLESVLSSHGKEVVVESFPAKGMWIVAMTLAPELARIRRQ